MLAFKDIRSARDFALLDPRLTNVILPEIMVVFDTYGVPTVVITSTIRKQAPTPDHPDGRAVDIRTWKFTRHQALEIMDRVNSIFPLPYTERPTMMYYDEFNSSYPQHFHVRVPKGDI